MRDLPNLPPEIDESLGELAEQILAAREAGDFARVLDLTEASWDVLPSPKVEWNFEPQAIALGAVEDIILAAAPEIGKTLDTWVERMYAAYFDPQRSNLLIKMVEGQAKHAMGRTAEAQSIFQEVYEAGGAQWFRGQYKPFLKAVKR